MLQVSASRPASQMTGRLPGIVHPMSRMGNSSHMDVRGVSRAGGREPPATASSRRPLANEADYRVAKRIVLRSSGGRQSGMADAGEKRSPPNDAAGYEVIPEGVEVTQGDPAKTRIPIFGNRPVGVSRDGSVASRLSHSSTQQRIETDELEMLLRERMKTGFSEYKKQFRDNDPEQKGNVSREVLQRILQTTLGRELTSSQMKRLLHRLGLKEKNVISFTEFYTMTGEHSSGATPRWLDTINRNGKPMTVAQVQGQQKIKASERDKEMFNLMGKGDGSVRVMKPEFRGILNRMGFIMEDEEFDKLWAKFDHDGAGNANSETLMRNLGVRPETNENGKNHLNGDKENSPYAHLPKMEAERQKSLDVERWLKNKFRQGIFTMKDAFCRYDQQKTGQVTHDHFITVLSEFGLKIEKSDLAAFLARCSVKPTNTHVDYFEFLFRFQDRGETGIPHVILTNAKHRYNAAESISGGSTFSAIEVKMMNMFQKDFLSLLGMFHKLDRLGRNVITQEEFRAVIESRFGIEMTDDQFAAMLERIPLDSDAMVKYADFMAPLDTRGKADSLFNGIGGRIDPPMTTTKRLDEVEEEEEEEDQGFDRLVVTTPPPDEYMVEIVNRRQPHELFKIIKDVMKRDFQLVEKEFTELDEKNSNRMSQETMFNLLKRLKVTPEVTRGEIRDLWKTFITHMDKSLDFHEFARHFGYSLKSAAFPNAKVSPPKKGDSDMRMRSRKLNCAADMLQDSLRSKIEYMCNDLEREFEAMDPYNTGCLSPDEFREILQELCVQLDNYELQRLCTKFRTEDDRVSYKEFLKPFVSRKELWRCGNNMHDVLRHSQHMVNLSSDFNPPVQKGFRTIIMKMHHQLTSDWKTMRRAFKKLDTHGVGHVSLSEFRSVLKGAGVALNEEDVYCIMSELDDMMTGRVAYSKFLSHVFLPKPSSRHGGGVRRSAVF